MKWRIFYSAEDNSFITYSNNVSSFNLEDTQDLFFQIKFNSKTNTALSIKRIILSFSDNSGSSFLTSPGTVKIIKNKARIVAKDSSAAENGSFSVTGINSQIYSAKNILLGDNETVSSVSIENTG